MRTLFSTIAVLAFCTQIGYTQIPNENNIDKPIESVGSEVGDPSNFIVSPSPCKGIIELSGIAETTLVEILDKNGDVIVSETGNNKIDLTSIADGPYFIRKVINKKTVMKRFVLIK